MSSKYFNKKNNIKVISIALFMTAVFALSAVSGIGAIIHKNASAAGADTVDIILGQKIVGSSVVASVCLLADTAINLGDTGVWLKYDNAHLTPNAALTAKGIYDGPADLSGSFAPMTWNLVAGRTDTHSMKAIFNSNPAVPIPNSTATTNNTPGLFGTATFNIGTVAGSNTITIDYTGTEALKRPTNTPLTVTVINYSGDCTSYRSGGVVSTPTLGAAPTTAITGTVGSPLPTITVTGSNLAANTPATFTPAGGTAIAGFITNGVFTPTAPATISANTITGNAIGLLAVTTPTGVAPLNIPTNFSAATVVTLTLGATPSIAITGTVGSYLPDIKLTGSNITSGTPATFTPAGGTAIPGTIENGYFRSSTFQPQKVISLNSTTGNAIGVLAVTTPTGVTPLNIPTNFIAAPVVVTLTLGTAPSTPITGTVGSSLPTITLTGTNLAANTPATFTPAGGTAITGFITNGVFTPTAPATISSGSLTGARNGVLSVTTPSGVTPLNIPTIFSAAVVPTVINQPGRGAVITITNNTSSSQSSTTTSSSEAKSQTTTQPVQDDTDTIELPKTGGIRKSTTQTESDSLPRTGGINQFQEIALMLTILSILTFYIYMQKRKNLSFDRNLKIK